MAEKTTLAKNDFAFCVGNPAGIYQMPMWVRKTEDTIRNLKVSCKSLRRIL